MGNKELYKQLVLAKPGTIFCGSKTPASIIEGLGLSRKPYHALKRNKIHTVDQLLKLSTSELFNIRGLGIKGIEQIIDKLEERGHNLKKETCWNLKTQLVREEEA